MQNLIKLQSIVGAFEPCVIAGVTVIYVSPGNVIHVSPGNVFPAHISLGMRVSPHTYP